VTGNGRHQAFIYVNLHLNIIHRIIFGAKQQPAVHVHQGIWVIWLFQMALWILATMEYMDNFNPLGGRTVK